MAKPGKCVHCLLWSDQITKDHVFPKAWYPTNTPENVERWTAPSCRGCNKKHGENEENLLLRIGMCIGPDELAAQGVSTKALRMVQPELARDERDRAAREKKRAELLKAIQFSDSPPTEGLFPNFGKQDGVKYEGYHTIRVPAAGLRMLGEKIMRGMHFKLTKRLIDKNFSVGVFFNRDQDIQDLLATLKRSGETIHKGPGIVVTRVSVHDSPTTTFAHIQIWGRLKINVVAVPNEKKGLLDSEIFTG